MLASSGPHTWVTSVPDGNPAAKSFRFDACFNGRKVEATAVARHDQIEIHPIAGKECLEMSLEAFEQLAQRLIVAAHTRR